MKINLTAIIKKCLKNDRKAQFQLYELCFEPLMKTCLRYKRQKEDARALFNEGFLKILLNLKSYDPEKEFMPWASTIMVRTAIDDFRKHKKYTQEIELIDQMEEVLLEDSYGEVVDQLSADDVQLMLSSLSEIERLVFTLYVAEDYKHMEIAESLGVSIRSSKRYLRSAKEKLKGMIEKKTDIKKVV